MHFTQEDIDELKKTNGKPIECLAAVAWEAKKPLYVAKVMVDPPKTGEVRVRVFYTCMPLHLCIYRCLFVRANICQYAKARDQNLYGAMPFGQNMGADSNAFPFFFYLKSKVI